jgi:hypothetical protein
MDTCLWKKFDYCCKVLFDFCDRITARCALKFGSSEQALQRGFEISVDLVFGSSPGAVEAFVF